MEYQKNVTLLQQAVAQHTFIRNIAFHRLPDGTPDTKGNLEIGRAHV